MRDWWAWARRNDRGSIAFLVAWFVIAVGLVLKGEWLWWTAAVFAFWTTLTMSMQACLLEAKQRRIGILERQVDALDAEAVLHGFAKQRRFPVVVHGEVVEP